MLKEEYELVKELSKIANKIKLLIPPMMLADLRLHISSIQRMIFAQEGIRSYRKDHAKYVVEHLPELFKKGSKHKVESITPTPDYGYQVKVTPILAEAMTGKKPIKITTRRVKKVPAGMEARPLTKKDIAELKELMTKGRPTVGPDTPEIRVYKKGSKIPKGWYRIPYTRDKYTTNEGYEKLTSQGLTEKQKTQIKQFLAQTDTVRSPYPGSRFVGGVHSPIGKREGWVEHNSPMFIGDIPHLENTGKPIGKVRSIRQREDGELKVISTIKKPKAKKKNIPVKKQTTKKSAPKKQARKKK